MKDDSNSKEKEKTLDNKKTTTGKRVKKTSKSKDLEGIAITIEENTNSNDEPTEKNNKNEEVISLDTNEIELTDEINNARKKRRRSSASIE